MRACLIAIVAFCVCLQATARDLYVSNLAGSDEKNGRKEKLADGDGPVATICRALKLAGPGDHIHVANTGTPYREQLSIFGCNLYGFEGRPLTISGNGATLDGAVIAADGAWRHIADDYFAMQPRRLTFQQLFKDGSPLKRVTLANHQDAGHVLKPLEWAYVEGQILMRVEKGNVPSMYNLRHAGLQTGITLYNTRHVVIDHFVVQGFQQDGINAHELVKHCTLRRVECRANGRSGLSTGGVSRVKVEQSNFYDNGRVQVRAEGLSKLDLKGCEVAAGENGVKYGLRGGRLNVDGQPASNEGE